MNTSAGKVDFQSIVKKARLCESSKYDFDWRLILLKPSCFFLMTFKIEPRNIHCSEGQNLRKPENRNSENRKIWNRKKHDFNYSLIFVITLIRPWKSLESCQAVVYSICYPVVARESPVLHNGWKFFESFLAFKILFLRGTRKVVSNEAYTRFDLVWNHEIRQFLLFVWDLRFLTTWVIAPAVRVEPANDAENNLLLVIRCKKWTKMTLNIRLVPWHSRVFMT